MRYNFGIKSKELSKACTQLAAISTTVDIHVKGNVATLSARGDALPVAVQIDLKISNNMEANNWTGSTFEISKLRKILSGSGHEVQIRDIGGRAAIHDGDLSFELAAPIAGFVKLIGSSTTEPVALPEGFESMLSAIRHFASTDQTRRHLNGALMGPEGIAATDGHRLAKIVYNDPVKHPVVIVPRDVIDALEGIVEPGTTFSMSTEGIQFCYLIGKSTRIRFTPIDEKFPPTDRVIPKSHKIRGRFEFEKLKSFAKRGVSTFGAAARIDFDPVAQWFAFMVTNASNEFELKARFAADCDTGTEPSRFDLRYLLESLNSLDTAESVGFESNGKLDPLVLRGKCSGAAMIHVIMPMRI